MPNFADVMNQVDARLDASRISDDLTLPDATVIRGRFVRAAMVSAIDTGLVGAGAPVTVIEFRTRATAAVLALREGEIVRHADVDYRVMRKMPPGGDNVGRVTLELGTT